MDHDAIAALAKGLVPFVRETVTAAVTPLNTRIAELEARPIVKGEVGERGPQGEIGQPGPMGPPGPKGDTETMLPSDLAEQVANAVRLLHESPPLAKPSNN